MASASPVQAGAGERECAMAAAGVAAWSERAAESTGMMEAQCFLGRPGTKWARGLMLGPRMQPVGWPGTAC